MPDKLATYRRKRDFRITPEPRTRGARASALRFVVQKHAARRLHYDFRLELEGVLKSWAVPKGPSLDPLDKRLAVHVEDHPLSYIDFEGIIPPKQYGAGEVQVWDQGRWLPQGDPLADYRAGKLKFHLRGKKLSGAWTLVRTRLTGSGGKEQWLLIKERDAAARPAADYNITEEMPGSVLEKKPAPDPDQDNAEARETGDGALDAASLTGAAKAAFPEKLEPQLATLVEALPSHGAWLYEIKFDGYRLLARAHGKTVRLYTRKGNDWTQKLPLLARAIQSLGLKRAWLDGEIVVLGKDGVPDFQALQNAFESSRVDQIQYFLFDLPYFEGYDLRRTPLSERRALLRRLLAERANGLLHFSEDFVENPRNLLATACRLSFEGIIAKRRDASYASGRNKSWLKLKCQRRQEFVIGGYTDPEGSRSAFGSLLLGVNEADGLRYVGRVGTGFNEVRLQAVHEQLKALNAERPPFKNPPREPGLHWVKPQLVAEVSFSQWTKDDIVRQAVFHGLRTDKPAADIKRERPQLPPETASAESRAPAPRRGGDIIAGVRISHPDRIIDKQSGLTKIDLARYYESVARWMLPHMKSRPVALVRAPDGIEGEHFFQKHDEHSSITGARFLDKKYDPGHAPLMVLDSVSALVGAAQMGAIEFHSWNSTVPAIEHPDRFILDLDPDPSLPWERVIEATELTKAVLESLDLQSFLKTTGGKGLHIVVPLVRRHSWEEVHGFSQAVARHLAETLPSRFSAKMGAKNRIKKVFVDYMRNRRGASTVSAFSARARPGLTVSVPVAWDELNSLKGSNRWDIHSVFQRLDSLEQDPWKDYRQAAQQLSRRMKQALGLASEKK